MKIRYKGIDIEKDKHGHITVYTENETLKMAMENCGINAESIRTIQEFIRQKKMTLVTNKQDLLDKKFNTVGKLVYKEKTPKGLYNCVFEVPTDRAYFEVSVNVDLEIGETYEMIGELKEDQWYNRNRATSLERRLGYVKYKFKASYVNKIKVKEEKVTYEKPRYELHCHTVHSKRDAHITHEELKDSFKTGKLGAVAITNHGINNCFPDSIKNFSKGSEKVIPAVELYVVDDERLELEISVWEAENEELLSRRSEIDGEILTLERLEEANNKILEEKTYAKGQAGVIKKQNVEYRKQKRELTKEYKEIEKKEKEAMLTKPNLGDADRRHLTCLVSSPDSVFKFRGKEVKYNPGIYELNKAITKANTVNFAVPIMNKWLGKRPVVLLSEVRKMKETGYFKFGSACSLGFITDAIIEGKLKEAESYLDIYDYLEIQPLRNNSYLLEPHHYPSYTSLDDLRKLNRRIFEFAKVNNKKVCFTSDSHIIESKDAYKRAMFKKSYFAMLEAKNSNPDYNKVLYGAREETQPFLHSYNEMILELKDQGFNDSEIEWIYGNEKEIAESCSYFNNTTIIPKQMFIPEFPGVLVKKEVPRIAEAKMKEMYGENPPQEIIDRLNFELDKVSMRDFEFIYYISMKIVEESEDRGYPVGSRGSIGSSVLALFLGITTNNALPPHYHCPNCHSHEWIDPMTTANGLDLPKKTCSCGHLMWSDGFNGQFTSFLGKDFDKVPDVDLNLSGEIQKDVQKCVVDWMSGNAWTSATMRYMKPDYLKQNVLSKYPNIEDRLIQEVDDEGNTFDFDFLADKIAGVNDGIGTHAGGILTLGRMYDDDHNEIDINLISPLVYPGDNTGTLPAVMHEYHMIENNISKSDMLGHGAPTTLKNLKEISGIDPFSSTVDISDPKLYEVLNDFYKVGTTDHEREEYKENAPSRTGNLGLPELSTDFLSQMITTLKPEKFSDIVKINGLSHGSGIWIQGQKEPLEAGLMTKEDVFGCREEVYDFLVKGGIEPGTAFRLVESLRKGKTLSPEETAHITNSSLKKVVQQNILRIQYLFPEAHSVSYSDQAMRIQWYRIYKPEAFYPVLLTQYASDVSEFDYQQVIRCDTKETLKKVQKSYSVGQNQKVVIKFKTRLSDVIFEAKIRGFDLKPANLFSHHSLFTIDPSDKTGKTIIMPLTTISGVAVKTAEKIYQTLKEKPFESYADLIARTDENNKKVFNKKALEGLGLYELDEMGITMFEKRMERLKED